MMADGRWQVLQGDLYMQIDRSIVLEKYIGNSLRMQAGRLAHESPRSILHHQPAIPKSESALKRAACVSFVFYWVCSAVSVFVCFLVRFLVF